MRNFRFCSHYMKFQVDKVDAYIAGIFCLRRMVVAIVGWNDENCREHVSLRP